MKKKIFITIFVALILVGVVFLLDKNKKSDIKEGKIKSVNLSTDYDIKQALNDIDDLKVNSVNIPVVINIDNINSNNIKIDESSEQKAIKLIKILKSKKINVILEPYPWIKNGSEYETDYDPLDKNAFFKDFKKILNTLVEDIGNKYNVDVIIVGSSFTKLEKYENNWCEIIDFVKSKYSGYVTYKTSWWYTASWDKKSIENYNKKLNNKIFDKVDFISIAAYFELSNKDENTVYELVSCLNSSTIYNRGQNIVEEIRKFYEKYNKQIYFAELGFPRRNKASINPWNSEVSNIENGKEQARCFEAYKILFEDKPYIKGFSVFAVGEKGKDKVFYPSKESIKVISSWYN